MRRKLAALLAVLMLAGCFAPALAEEGAAAPEDPVSLFTEFGPWGAWTGEQKAAAENWSDEAWGSYWEDYAESAWDLYNRYSNDYYTWQYESYDYESSWKEYLVQIKTGLGMPYPEGINVSVNGAYLDMGADAPIAVSGRTLVPFRAFLERLGASVSYSGGTITAVLADGEKLELHLDSTVLKHTAGEKIDSIDMGMTPYVSGGRTYIPVRFAAEALGYEVKTVSHDDDASRQLEAIEAAIADKAAFIVLDNAGADATIEAVQAAYDAGIPCFLIDREINTTGIAVAQIVADNAQGAAAIAEKWVEAMNYEGKYAELLGLESDTNCQVRSENFHSVIDQYEGLEMVAQQSANWDQTEAYEKTEAILEANPEITGIICGNDTMACGAAAACADAGRSDIKIIGVDGSDDAAALIKSGQMVGTALQQCALIAQMAVEQGHYYINNNGATLDGVGEKQLVPCVAITIDNVDNLSAFVYTEG